MFAFFSALRNPLGWLATLFPVLLLSACQTTLPGAGTGQGQRVNPSGPIPVALLVPHGSATPDEQKLARDLENAARMAVADMSGVQIDLRVYGTAGNAAQAQSAARNAVADGAKIVIGPLHAESANAVAVAVAPSDVNVLAFSNNSTIAGGNLFVLGQTFDDTADRLARFAASQGKTRVLTVYSDNLAGQLGRRAIEQAVQRAGSRNAGAVSYEFSQQGVVSAVPQIRTMAETHGADTIFLTANAAGALPLFSQMLPEAGLSPDVIQYIGLARWDTPAQTLDLPGVQGGWFTIPDPGRAGEFRNRFMAANGEPPHALAGLSYDALAAIGALARTGRTDALSRNSLMQPAGFRGVTGVFRFKPDGTTQRGLAVATVRNHKMVVISPAPQSFGGAGF